MEQEMIEFNNIPEKVEENKEDNLSCYSGDSALSQKVSSWATVTPCSPPPRLYENKGGGG